jgi:hypothetical protein
MAITFPAAGYVVTGEHIIYAAGVTREAAWNDLIAEMDRANVVMLTEDEANERDPMGENTGEYVLTTSFTVRPATAALMAYVLEQGGVVDWKLIDDVACTRDESDAARAIAA